ncbi:cysteine desulfurase family protein [Paratractidigestivibacter sp.]|uniref:cysteine desulfurase family protein n=1 Tax=Paratractidigestivibacter sp. TaxID=2847316 RepID=UPI002AC9E03C|nr:cysteine desulfurase family protein [Paratractidigestivibacter sp.]
MTIHSAAPFVPAAHTAEKRFVYLDYAAATPMDSDVAAAMAPYFCEKFFNPGAPYAAARGVRADVDQARTAVAHAIGARPGNVTFTAGATEANNLAFAAVDPGAHVVVSAVEHESVLACAEARSHAIVGVGGDGRVSAGDVAAALTPATELVSVELANGEVGAIQPVREIARVVAAERARRLAAVEKTPIYLHTDASQAAGALAVNVGTLGCDMLTLSAAKIYGPKQVGLLWSSDDVALRPLVIGGGQENGVRSGTENVAGIVGFARALELAGERRGAEARRLAALRNRLQQAVCSEFCWARVSGPRANKLRLPGLLHVSFPGLEARRLVIALEREGVSVGTGSACAASKMRASHVLAAMGASDEVAAGSLRITLGHPTTEDDVDYAAAAIARAVAAECARTGIDPTSGESGTCTAAGATVKQTAGKKGGEA